MVLCLFYNRQYPSIEDGDQRMRYKQDFNEHYEEYRRLHEKVQNVARRFQYLRERISNTKEGTQDYEVSGDRIVSIISNTCFIDVSGWM